MEIKDFKKLAASQEESLRFIAKETEKIARYLKKTPWTEDRLDQAKSNVVQASFMLNSYAIGIRAFNKMIADNDKDPENNRNLVEYFKDEIDKMSKLEEERIKAENEPS